MADPAAWLILLLSLLWLHPDIEITCIWKRKTAVSKQLVTCLNIFPFLRCFTCCVRAPLHLFINFLCSFLSWYFFVWCPTFLFVPRSFSFNTCGISSSNQDKIPRDSILIHRRNSYTPLSSHDQVKRPRLYSVGNQPWLPLAPTPSALMPEELQSQVSDRVTGKPSKSVTVSCNQSCPTTVVTLCLAFPCLSFGSSWWFRVCVATDIH